MRKLNILYVENFSEIIGGGQKSLLDLLDRLDRGRFNPLAVCPSVGSLSEALTRLNIEIKIIELPSLKKLNIFRIIKAISEFRRLIRDKEIDLIHSNGSRACFYAGIAARYEKIPLVWHVRIADKDWLLDRFLASLSEKIIAISEAVKKRFDWIKDRDGKVRIIYNGIDLVRFNPSLVSDKVRKEFGLSSQMPLVGIVGRLDWYKGHQYFLGAAKKVVKDIPGCCFLIAGDGEKRKGLEALMNRLDLNNNVIFAGNREDIPEVLAGLDLFVLSSISEGLGRSIIEAMAMQKAVVATNVGGISEVVKNKETGILVPARDDCALADAIIGLLKDRDRAFKMGQAGRRRAEAMFDLDTNVKETQKLYLDLLLD